MDTIAYCNPFVPPEWIAAHGMRPLWLSLGPTAMRRSIGAGRATCPFVGALLDTVRSGLQAAALVLTTTCDQMRYAAAVLQHDSDLPVFLLNVPTTWQTEASERWYRDELERFGGFLRRISGTAPPDRQLADVMIAYDDARAEAVSARATLTARQYADVLGRLRGGQLRPLQSCRSDREATAGVSPGATGVSPVPASGATGVSPVPDAPETLPLSPVQHGQDARGTQQVQADGARSPSATGVSPVLPNPSGPEACANEPTIENGDQVQRESAAVRDGVPLAILGGPLLEKDLRLLDLIEASGGRLVLDATESGERTLPAVFDRQRLANDPLGELVRAYFGTIPDVFRRPNDRLFDWLTGTLSQRQAQGLLFHRYVWCDAWHAELPRIKARSPVPVLELDECDDDASLSRTGGRIEAFLELLR